MGMESIKAARASVIEAPSPRSFISFYVVLVLGANDEDAVLPKVLLERERSCA